MIAHVVLLTWVPGCAIACRWQIGVALSGDSLGWVYSVMWPCFAVFGIVFWWYFVHDDPTTVGRRGLRRLQQAEETGGSDQHGVDERDPRVVALARAEAEDPELAAYNDYLAALARDARPSTWRAR
jgi:hypothetical protein